MKKLTTQESNYIIDRLMELMDTEVGKKYTDELLIAMLCIQINELEGKLATEREMAETSSLCDNCATVGCIFQAGIKKEKCGFYTKPKTVEWKKISPARIYECSECGQMVKTDNIGAYKFCHGCGARMNGGEKSE